MEISINQDFFFIEGNFETLTLFHDVNKMEASSRDAGVPVSRQAKPKQLPTPPELSGLPGHFPL